MESFWHGLARPFFVLAPMEDVTDVAFRALIAQYSDPTIPRVMYTEFTSADGLLRADEDGMRKLRKKLEFNEGERPIVAQLFTANPEYMEAGARLCSELGFDGFDINMGCPAREVERQGCGSALIRTPELARELIRAAQRGAESAGRRMAVSVKTRIGYNEDELETWLPELLSESPDAVILHARTRREMSDVPARWERVARAVEIRDSLSSKTLIVGNGDVQNLSDAREKIAATHADGAMIGRGIFGNPWLFTHRAEPTPQERMGALLEHLELFDKLLTGTTHYATMKKHFKAYISGWDNAKDLRIRLMETESISEAKEILGAM